MTTPLQSTDLAALHTDIAAAVKDAFPDFKTVAFYLDDEAESLPLPACLLALDEVEPLETDPGTGQLMSALRFSARLIFSREEDATAPLQCRMAATALSAFINKRRWACARVSPARIISCVSDDFRPSRNGAVAIWRVEWVHPEAAFGENIWEATDPRIRQVFVAHAPLQQGTKEIWERGAP